MFLPQTIAFESTMDTIALSYVCRTIFHYFYRKKASGRWSKRQVITTPVTNGPRPNSLEIYLLNNDFGRDSLRRRTVPAKVKYIMLPVVAYCLPLYRCGQ